MRRGKHLDQYILAFAVEFRREQADAGGVAAGMRERFDQSRRHHVLGHSDKPYRVRKRLQRLQGKLGTGNDRIGGGVDQRRGLLGEMLIGRLKTTRDNYEIVPLDKAVLAQLIKESGNSRRVERRRHQKAETIDVATFLCARVASGQAVAEPAIILMKSRRRICLPKATDCADLECGITAGFSDRRNGVQRSVAKQRS